MNIVFVVILSIVVFAVAEDYKQQGGKWFVGYLIAQTFALPLAYIMHLLLKAMP